MTDNAHGPAEKKVDEAWKKRAREEKEQPGEQQPSSGETESASDEKTDSDAAAAPESTPLPPPSFAGLVAGLATQAFISLGQVENPLSGKVEEDLDAARHALDTLAMLREKTSGNLTDEESAYLEEILYSLRMAYVRKSRE